MEMDLEVCCTKYVTENTIAELASHIRRYKYIKNDKYFRNAVFTLRDGEVIVANNKDDALYYAFMMCISNCPQGIELFMRCSTNYLQLKTIYNQRKNHKLREDWINGFCQDFVKKLPYAEEFIIGKSKKI